MHNVDHAMAVLRERTGLEDLELNRNGEVEIVFDDSLTIRLHRVDDSVLELHTKVGSLGPAPTVERLMTLLSANYLGQATGAGRVAIDSRDGGILLGERLTVTEIDADVLERHVLGFVQHAKVWLGGDVERLLTDPRPETPNQDGPATETHDFIVRA